MAVVLAGYTILQLISMAASAGSFGASVGKIVDDLKAKGHPVDKPIPVDAQLAVQKAMRQLPQPEPADFGILAQQDRPKIQAAIDATAAIYIEDATIAACREQALMALYKLAEYLDVHA